jgi:hypothetical protein
MFTVEGKLTLKQVWAQGFAEIREDFSQQVKRTVEGLLSRLRPRRSQRVCPGLFPPRVRAGRRGRGVSRPRTTSNQLSTGTPAVGLTGRAIASRVGLL